MDDNIYTYVHEDAVNKAVSFLKPKRLEVAGYKTSRSGLKVNVTRVNGVIDDGYANRNDKTCVNVQLDGPVDKHDAEQLARFFSLLSARLPTP